MSIEQTIKLVKDRERLLEVIRQKIPSDTLKNAFQTGIGYRQFVSLSQEETNKVSYATKPSHVFDNIKRQRTTIQRYLGRIINPEMNNLMSESDIDRVSAEIIYTIWGGEIENLNIVSGYQIQQTYKQGFAYSSCMTGSDSDKMQLLAQNPDNVSLVKYNFMGVNARALLWTSDSGKRILDRIYPNQGNHILALHDWCDSQGIIYRVSQSYPDGIVYLSDNSNYQVTLDVSGIEDWPFLDTFCYSRDIGKNQAIFSNTPDEMEYEYFETCGSRKEIDESYDCYECGNSTDGDYHYNGDYYCDSCYCDNFSSCGSCGETVPTDDITIAEDSRGNQEYYCTDCVRSNSWVCDDCHIRYTDNVSSYEVNGENLVCENCLENYYFCENCNKYYSDTNNGLCEDCYNEKYGQCVECDEEIEKDSNFKIDNNYYCPDCFAEINLTQKIGV
jgi:hypothetical protein